MKVAVGSLNPVKIEGVRRVFARVYGDVEVLGVNCGGVRQPVGAKETLVGAYSRARCALEAVGDADYGVGVEAGLVELPAVPGIEATHLNAQFAVVVDRRGVVGVGSSSAFELPKKVLEDIVWRGRELDESFSERYGFKDLGRSLGVVYALTKGLVDRCSLVEECVRLALIPFLNPELYG